MPMPKAPGTPPPRVWPGNASRYLMPALSALSSALTKGTKWKVHIWTPIFQSFGEWSDALGGELSDAAEVVEDWSLKEEVENKAKLIRQQEVKYLMIRF